MVIIDWCEHGLNPMISKYPKLHSDIFTFSRCEHAIGNPSEGSFIALSINNKKRDYDTICCDTCARKQGYIW